MITIYPNLHTSNNYYGIKKNFSTDTNTTTQPQPQTNSIAFKGWGAADANRYFINKIAGIIKDEAIKKMAIVAHFNPDEDAVSGSLMLKQLIKKSTGKDADVIMLNPLAEKHRYIDPNNTIKVINNTPDAHPSIEEVQKTYGNYDAIFAVDVATERQLDKEILEGIIKPSKKNNPKSVFVDIDHHKKTEGEFADVTLVDTTRKSVTQLLMQFTKALGVDISDPEISKLAATGLIGDSRQFRNLTPGALQDAERLSKNTNFEEIINAMNVITPREFKLCNKILGQTEFNEKGNIAYAIFDAAGENIAADDLKAITIKALDKMAEVKGVKYYFLITKNSADPNFKVSASIRSSAKPIAESIEKLGGGGAPRACGLKANGKTPEQMKEAIIETLSELAKD